VVANPIHQWQTLHPSFIHKCIGVNIEYCKTLSPHILDQLGLGFFYKLELTFNFTKCLEFHNYIELCNNVFLSSKCKDITLVQDKFFSKNTNAISLFITIK
jgi:hypothetical protein